MASVPELAAMARKHWTTYLPSKTKELKRTGMFEVATQRAAEQAMNQIRSLMESGYQEHEAEEVARQQILLRPEADDLDVPADQKRELAQKERQYQSQARGQTRA